MMQLDGVQYSGLPLVFTTKVITWYTKAIIAKDACKKPRKYVLVIYSFTVE